MPLIFPLSTSDFFEWLPVGDMTFHCPGAYEANEDGNGEILTASLGQRLWTGEVTLGDMTMEEVAKSEVYLTLLQDTGRSFMAYDKRFPAPLRDPRGDLLGAAVPTIGALDADVRLIGLADLPAGYTLSVRDYLSFSYGSDPERFALHRVVPDTVVADGTGATGLFEVTPPIREGAQIGAAVSLFRAPCKAKIVPDSVDHGSNKKRISKGTKFRIMQTLR